MTLDPARTAWADEYPFESHWHTTGSGHKLHYLDEGPRDAPVMLMVHGNPTWSFYYRRLVQAFSKDFRCVVPDHIGCGLSEKPQEGYGYELEDRVSDLEGLAAKLGLKDITLVVHDWGGAIGMGYATRHVDTITRLVVFNTAAFLSPRIPFSIDICRIPGFGPLAVRGLNGFVRVAQLRAIHDHSRLQGAVGQGYVAPYDSWANRIAVQRFVEDIPMEPAHPSYKTLKGIDEGIGQFADHPMLIVWGDQDFCFDVSFRKEWQRRFPEAECHALKDASHYVLEDAHERIIPWMNEFIERT